ncbi:Putative deoxyribonuclease RhsC [Stieleria neptunia]|uniref:Deoxyribonuclease RhsC n=1 Tax=Stieleria neptunia TaxID=2527979 RepID=A0A518I2T3_9BACT|nr:RHS repeat-associated core domain-containing protein [Stieleria neptunia]QDV47420.1 Putative deoxyribonuclease RhsC [Stieleria neptunia]
MEQVSETIDAGTTLVRDYTNGQSSTSADWTISADNRLDQDDSYDYIYDNEGRLTKRTSRLTPSLGAFDEFTWDPAGRLITVARYDTTAAIIKTIEYGYDANGLMSGRRVMDASGAVTSETGYLHDGLQRIAELDLTGTDAKITELYLHGTQPNEIVATDVLESGAFDTVWGYTDALGSLTTVASKASGDWKVVHNVTSEYGGNREKLGDDTEAALTSTAIWAGHHVDPDTGLIEAKARWFDPTTGRFISQDPIGFAAGDANLYRYVGNGPGNSVDPNGLEEQTQDQTDKLLAKRFNLRPLPQYYKAYDSGSFDSYSFDELRRARAEVLAYYYALESISRHHYYSTKHFARNSSGTPEARKNAQELTKYLAGKKSLLKDIEDNIADTHAAKWSDYYEDRFDPLVAKRGNHRAARANSLRRRHSIVESEIGAKPRASILDQRVDDLQEAIAMELATLGFGTLARGLKGLHYVDDLGTIAPNRLATGAGYVDVPDPGAVARYGRIVDSLDDATISQLSRHANVPENVIRSVKSHLFETVHPIQTAPGVVRRGRFTPMNEIADVWESALRGEGRDAFRNLLGHEYLESTLMKHGGLPFRPPGNPSGMGVSAHNLSPNPWSGELGPGQLRLWDEFFSQ